MAHNLASWMLLPWKVYRLFDKKQSTYLSNTLVCEREKGYVKNTEITEGKNKKNKKIFCLRRENIINQKDVSWEFPGGQRLRLHTVTAEGQGSVPAWGTTIPQAKVKECVAGQGWEVN